MYKSRFPLVATLLISCIAGHAQQKTDASFLFKMWFFIEKGNVDTSSIKISWIKKDLAAKNSSYFRFFDENLKLNLDTLKSDGFEDNFIFLSLDMRKKSIEHFDSANKTLGQETKSELAWYLLISSNCNRYVIGINRSSGVSYRLSGFDENDFLNFLDDVKRVYHYWSRKKLTNHMFFRDFTVDELDFRCLHKALRSKYPYDSDKYPCVRKCSAMLKIY